KTKLLGLPANVAEARKEISPNFSAAPTLGTTVKSIAPARLAGGFGVMFGRQVPGPSGSLNGDAGFDAVSSTEAIESSSTKSCGGVVLEIELGSLRANWLIRTRTSSVACAGRANDAHATSAAASTAGPPPRPPRGARSSWPEFPARVSL